MLKQKKWAGLGVDHRWDLPRLLTNHNARSQGFLQGNFDQVLMFNDTSNFKKVSKIIKNIKPNLLIHCAGQVTVTKSVINPRNDFNSNALGSFNILESIRLFSNKTKYC